MVTTSLLQIKWLPVEMPLAANGVAEEIRIGTGRFPIDLIVRAHNTGYFAFNHTGFEWYIIGVGQVLLAYLHTIIIRKEFNLGP